MKRNISIFGGFAAFVTTLATVSFHGCCPSACCNGSCSDGRPAASAVSLDGRNEICLWTNPLAYEVRRGGKTLVAKSPIDLTVNGQPLDAGDLQPTVHTQRLTGTEQSPVYKKSQIDLSANETFADFGTWGVRLVARNDGVAYRFETRMNGTITVNAEKASLRLACPKATCTVHKTSAFGCEENVASIGGLATDVVTKENEMVYLPAVFQLGGQTLVVTESDVYDYPVWNLRRPKSVSGPAAFDAVFAAYPAETFRSGKGGWESNKPCTERARWETVKSRANYLVQTEGTRTFPWRAFTLADKPMDVIASDLVRALARPAEKGMDFSWVKPGKVTWEWWNAWDNVGDPGRNGPSGCTTEVYRRFFDLAAEFGVEYVIFDEGWSAQLNIWKLNPTVDLKALIDYGNAKGVGTILWMAWGQIVGDEEHVAEEFGKMGVKGFKVDFMDRGDAQCERFYWAFAKACAKRHLVVDYHGAHRPTGISRAYPNVLNYEGVHGLEQMKFYRNAPILANDVALCFTRLSAGPMDYTPGAMDNYPIDGYPDAKKVDTFTNPGSLGTRSRQMAMMALYEAPLQMLCDAVNKYRKNRECFAFMAATPVVWADTVALGGSPETYAACARRAKDGSWYASAINSTRARTIPVDTAFLGAGEWEMEIFRDGDATAADPTRYVHAKQTVRAGTKLDVALAPGGGFVAKFIRK